MTRTDVDVDALLWITEQLNASITCDIGNRPGFKIRFDQPEPPCTHPATWTLTVHRCGTPAGWTAVFCSHHLADTTRRITDALDRIRARGGKPCCQHCGRPVAQLSDLIWNIQPL